MSQIPSSTPSSRYRRVRRGRNFPIQSRVHTPSHPHAPTHTHTHTFPPRKNNKTLHGNACMQEPRRCTQHNMHPLQAIVFTHSFIMHGPSMRKETPPVSRYRHEEEEQERRKTNNRFNHHTVRHSSCRVGLGSMLSTAGPNRRSCYPRSES